MGQVKELYETKRTKRQEMIHALADDMSFSETDYGIWYDLYATLEDSVLEAKVYDLMQRRERHGF